MKKFSICAVAFSTVVVLSLIVGPAINLKIRADSWRREGVDIYWNDAARNLELSVANLLVKTPNAIEVRAIPGNKWKETGNVAMSSIEFSEVVLVGSVSHPIDPMMFLIPQELSMLKIKHGILTERCCAFLATRKLDRILLEDSIINLEALCNALRKLQPESLAIFGDTITQEQLRHLSRCTPSSAIVTSFGLMRNGQIVADPLSVNFSDTGAINQQGD